MATLGLFYILSLIFACGIITTILLKNLKFKRIEDPSEDNRFFMDIIQNPKNALEQGRADMFKTLLDMYYKLDGDTMVSAYHTLYKDKGCAKLAELISDETWRIKNYSGFDLNHGRISRQYTATNNPSDFEQYVLGGRQIIDELDRELARIHQEKEIEQARLYGLKEFDRHHNESRKELRKLQDPKERANEELSEFDRRMREIENENS